MSRRTYVSSLNVARESLRLGRVVIETDRRRSQRVKELRRQPPRGAFDNKSYFFCYGAEGVAFAVFVYEYKLSCIPGNEDGIAVHCKGADDKSETAVFYPRPEDLPAPVRAGPRPPPRPRPRGRGGKERRRPMPSRLGRGQDGRSRPRYRGIVTPRRDSPSPVRTRERAPGLRA